MEFTQKIRARILGTLLLVFSIGFIGVPLWIGGHPGEPVMTAAADHRLS